MFIVTFCWKYHVSWHCRIVNIARIFELLVIVILALAYAGILSATKKCC